MISQRTSGLNAVLALCQLVLTAAFFWAEVVLVLVVYGHGLQRFLHEYVVYTAVILLGLLIETLSNKRLESGTVHRDFIAAHRLSFRQTLFGAGLWFAYMVGTQDRVHSRTFVACFVPTLYLLLLFTNRFLPRLLGRRFFAEERWEKTLLGQTRGQGRGAPALARPQGGRGLSHRRHPLRR